MEKLTIVITAYNLEQYIEQAVLSILKQKVNFEYKVRIADDCSTDHTIEILKRLKEKHPDKIDLLLNEKNLGSLKNSNRAFEGIRSEYISFLDGDDFWIGENQLQRKIDFLDSHPDYVLCGANTIILYSNGQQKNFINISSDHHYDFQDSLYGRVPYVHTSSLILRNCIYKNGMPQIYYDVEDTFENCALRGEEFRFISHLEKGKLMVFAEVGSCYRIHEKGIWQGASETKRMIETAIKKNFYDKYFSGIQEDTFRIMCVASYRNLMRHLLDKKIYNQYFLTAEETSLLSEYLKEIATRDIPWTRSEITYTRKQNISLAKKIWRAARKKFNR